MSTKPRKQKQSNSRPMGLKLRLRKEGALLGSGSKLGVSKVGIGRKLGSGFNGDFILNPKFQSVVNLKENKNLNEGLSMGKDMLGYKNLASLNSLPDSLKKKLTMHSLKIGDLSSKFIPEENELEVSVE